MTEFQVVFTAFPLILLVLDLVFSAMRSAFLNTNLARLLGQRDQAHPQLANTLAVLNSMSRLQAAVHLSRTLTRFLLAGLLLVVLLPTPQETFPLLTVVGILLLAALLVFALEWIVEGQVARSPETWARRLTPLARSLMFLATPLLVLPLALSREANGAQDGAGTVTEDELMNLVEAGQQEGLLEQDERRMIVSIFRLGDTLAREIMVPRIDVIALEVNTPLPQTADVILESGHSRLPVYEETVDNILGLLYAKDLLRVWREGNHVRSLNDLLRPAYFVPETKKVDELLAELQAQRIHMAIVVDEYGGVAGLVTLEDIVEEIVGEILDEYDQAEEVLYQILNEKEYIFQGRVDLDDFNEIVGSQLPIEEADTLGGLIYSRIGRVPVGGESLEIDDVKLTVEQVSGRRIRKVRAFKMESQRVSPELPNGDEDHHA